tara:strand:- start:158 stop:478 length:321 start_codon:yes stop_codon:yes gene_type:complete
MSKFEEREKSFEKKFQMDEELKFKISARANKHLGGWAAKILGINDKDKIQNYIQEVIKSDLQEEGQEDVFRKIKKDFETASISIDDKEIRNAMETSLQNAKEDFKK